MGSKLIGKYMPKFILQGPQGCGKSWLRQRLRGDEELSKKKDRPFGGASTCHINKGTSHDYELWDLWEDDKKPNANPLNYRNANLGVFVIDYKSLLDERAKARLKAQHDRYLEQGGAVSGKRILVLSKSDTVKENQKKDFIERGKALANELNIEEVFMCSAKNEEGIKKLKHFIDVYAFLITKKLTEISSSIVKKIAISSYFTHYKANISKTALTDFDTAMSTLDKFCGITQESEWGKLSEDHSYARFRKSLIRLMNKAIKECNKVDQKEIAKAVKNLTDNFSHLTSDAIKIFAEATAKYQNKPSWKELLTAFIGALIGIAIGAGLAVFAGPIAAIPAVAITNTVVLGVSGATLGFWGSFWSSRAADPLNQIIKNANAIREDNQTFKIV
jgi:ethanolamine utilization protein EutP (predicted NTPase)